MVSVYEKYFIDRYSCDGGSYSPQKSEDTNVNNSSDNNLVYNELLYSREHRKKISHNQQCRPSINEVDCEESKINGRKNIIIDSTITDHSSRKKIIWNNRVIDQINTTLRESSGSSSSEQDSFRESFSDEGQLVYSREVRSKNNSKYSNETDEDLFDCQDDYGQFRRKNKATTYTKVKSQKPYKKNTGTRFNTFHSEQSEEPKGFCRKTSRNITFASLVDYKYRQENVNYDEVLNSVRQRTVGWEDWVEANQPKISLLGDSHTRFLASIIKEMLPGFKVESIVKPGAKTRRVLSSLQEILQNVGENDFVVIISGTNDMWSESLEEAKGDIYDAVSSSAGTNLLLCSIPNNYLEPVDSPVQDNILDFNQFYSDVVNYSKQAHLVDLYQLKDRSLFTRHGLHFNQDGKIKICEKVSLKILDILDSINM